MTISDIFTFLSQVFSLPIRQFYGIIETLLMSILYGSQIQGMLPKLMSTNHPGMELIRPLYYVKEEDITHFIISRSRTFTFLMRKNR